MLALNHRYNNNLIKFTVEDYKYCDFDENDMNSLFNGLNTSCVLEYRMMEEELEDSETAVVKWYKDVFYFGGPRDFVERKKERGQFYEDRYVARNGYYEYSNMMSNEGNTRKTSEGSVVQIYNTKKVSVSLRNELDKSNIRITQNNSYTYSGYWHSIGIYNPEYSYDDVDTLEVNIEPNLSQDYNFKLQYNAERIFDGFFYLTPKIREILAENDNEIDINRSLLRNMGDWNYGNSVPITVPQLMKQMLRESRQMFVDYVELMSNV